MKTMPTSVTHYVDYVAHDKLLKNINCIPEAVQKAILLDSNKSGTNKLSYDVFKEHEDGSFSIIYKGLKFDIPSGLYDTYFGGNVHNVFEATKAWRRVAGVVNNASHEGEGVAPGIHRTGFWIPMNSNERNSRDICLGGPYDKKAIKESVDSLVLPNGGRIYTELYRHDISLAVDQIIIPSSKCAQELTQGLNERRIYPCVNGQELRDAGFDTDSVDWNSDKAVTNFINRILPEKRRFYSSPQLLSSFQIGDNSIGVYGVGEERVIAFSLLDFELQNKLTEGRIYSSDVSIKGGRGDAQVGGRDAVKDLFEVLDSNVNHAIATSMKLSFAGSSLVHVNDTPNLAGIKEADLEAMYDWAKNDTNDYPVRFIKG